MRSCCWLLRAGDGPSTNVLLLFLLLLLLFRSHSSLAAEQSETERLLNSVNATTLDGATFSPPTTVTSNVTAAPVTPTNTTARMPNVFGMRVELPADDPFGYDKDGICIVTPDAEFKVVLYGNHLDKIERIWFTESNISCLVPTRTVDAVNDFIVHFQHKCSFKLSLPPVPEGVNAYRMCVIPKGVSSNDVIPVATQITTEKPVKQYFLPLPVQIAIIAFLLCLSALFSGLTLGLMSLTPQELELVQKSGSPSEQKYATAILPVRRKGNLLLCSLLLGNVIVNSGISILFGDLTTGLLALFISSFGIVVFGEIVPQSICVKKGLAVGAHTIFITQFFIFLTFPIAWPISKILDYLLGDEYVVYDRKRLMELIRMSIRGEDGRLNDELKIAVGAMELADKVVEDVMTKIDDVFMLPDTTVLNTKTVAEIVRMGYTRIPVYSYGDKNNITDLLFVKDLALLDPDDNFTVKTVCGYHKHVVKFTNHDTPLREILEEFKKGEGHLAMVRKLVEGTEHADPSYELVGIVTLEDIVEEILQAEIVDEFDVVTDNVNRIRRKNYQQRDPTKFLEKEPVDAVVSLQIQMVALQFLVANEPALGSEYIDKDVLERVDMSALRAMAGSNTAPSTIPRLAKLYTKDEDTDRFILVLEGRVHVTIGQGQMTFEAGPWHRFGSEVLTKLRENANNLMRSSSIVDSTDLSARRPDLMFRPDFTAVVREDATYLEITVPTYINAYKSSLIQREKNRLGSQQSLNSNCESPIAVRKTTITNQSVREPFQVAKDITETLLGPRPSVEDARLAVKALNNIETEFKETAATEEAVRLLDVNKEDE